MKSEILNIEIELRAVVFHPRKSFKSAAKKNSEAVHLKKYLWQKILNKRIEIQRKPQRRREAQSEWKLNFIVFFKKYMNNENWLNSFANQTSAALCASAVKRIIL